MSLGDTSPILSICLERFERQAQKSNRDDIVVFFCKEVIPFFSQNSAITNLRDRWRSHRDFLNHQTQKYENDDPESSQLFKFIKFIFKSLISGKKKAELEFPWETASKHINRIKLPNTLSETFFGKGHGSTFCFNGLVVELSDDSVEVLRELRERHLKCKINRGNRR